MTTYGASILLGLIAAALFLLAAFHVALGGVDLGWLAAAFLSVALVVPHLAHRTA